eukprot:SM000243S08574  [mRNA]  locus=s243:124348:126775:+ [translate_table: standard]
MEAMAEGGREWGDGVRGSALARAASAGVRQPWELWRWYTDRPWEDEFFPLVIDTHGAFGARRLELLHQLLRHTGASRHKRLKTRSVLAWRLPRQGLSPTI